MLPVNLKKVSVLCTAFPAESQRFPVLHRIVQRNLLLKAAVNVLKSLLPSGVINQKLSLGCSFLIVIIVAADNAVFSSSSTTELISPVSRAKAA